MLHRIRQVCRGCCSVAVLEYGLVGVLVAVVIFSSVQLLVTSGSQDLTNPDLILDARRSGS